MLFINSFFLDHGDMKLLLKAVFKTKRHLAWLLFSLVMLFGVTIADQAEMISLGVVADVGIDFFQLFDAKESLSKEKYLSMWDELDAEQKGEITKIDVSSYVANQPQANPIKKVFQGIKQRLSRGEHKFVKIVIVLVFIGLMKAFFLFYSRFATRVLAIRICKDLRNAYFQHIQTLSMRFFHQYDIGALSTRVTSDASQIALSFNSWITNYLQTPFVMLSTLSLCFYFSLKLSLMIFLGIPMVVIPVSIITKKIKKAARALQKNQEHFASILIDFIAGIQTIKIFSMEKFALKKYKEHNDAMVKLEYKTNRYDVLTRPILHFFVTFLLVMILFVGLYYLKMELAELIAYCGLLHLFYEPIRRFADENANVQRGVVAAERLFEIMEIKPEVRDYPGAMPVTTFKESLVFENVHFAYKDKQVLEDVNFTVDRGETVAIVGATGAGKSTILQLILRLYDPVLGEIKIDGGSLKAYTQDSIRSLISFVPQKPFLFNDTVRSNIVYGQEVSEQEMIRAAKKAHAHEFIIDLPGGYDSHLAEMGKDLSGGQQQRLAIARALLRKSPILMLDEATSSLDTLSEKKIQEAIVELHGEITQIIVAHRLSTIEHADKVVFLDRGKVIAVGDKGTLYQQCEKFRAMWEASQLAGAFEPMT